VRGSGACRVATGWIRGGDLHAVAPRGLLTGNRGCVVDDHERVVRHHGSSLWIICLTEFRDWRWLLARPRRWTPLFFLDDAVALAAGHRPCATCRRADYSAYRDAVTHAIDSPVRAWQLNKRLEAERHRRGRGLVRAGDRIVWSARYAALPDGTVVVAPDGSCRLVIEHRLLRFSFDGWVGATPRSCGGNCRTDRTRGTGAIGASPCIQRTCEARGSCRHLGSMLGLGHIASSRRG
jgi:hypothetical protein